MGTVTYGRCARTFNHVFDPDPLNLICGRESGVALWHPSSPYSCKQFALMAIANAAIRHCPRAGVVTVLTPVITYAVLFVAATPAEGYSLLYIYGRLPPSALLSTRS